MLQKFETERLVLRPYDLSDAPRAQKIGDDKAVAETTFIPYPYTLEKVEDWIKNHSSLIENGDAYPLAVILKSEKQLIGTMTIRIDKNHHKGELAYWVGKDYWGKGYATEASKKMLEFGFKELNLNRIWAPVMSKNKASGKVMQKVGLSYEGTLKQDILRWDKYEDIDIYGLLKKDYN
ncbi:GNAT family N-acetyltransferase [Salirhabdus salicampi]|uniref:GNAT family N-acetyltransferase n=1 Tax=Salirhabdus salicampi TaxID=476102 RepID=UPI0020C25440|nr:GNAT family N-acetyltransferase [Salirhabdus salicampi]MCP8617945.1 GNAT family N-acetyltransferase [Salirhabdus salicampi]